MNGEYTGYVQATSIIKKYKPKSKITHFIISFKKEIDIETEFMNIDLIIDALRNLASTEKSV